MKNKLFKLLILTSAVIATAEVCAQQNRSFDFSDSHGFRARQSMNRAAERQGVTATLKFERLPDMKKPRMGHQSYAYNSHLFVVGGHTTGYKLTATAERCNNMESWRGIDVKAHDCGFYGKRRLNGTTYRMVGGGFSGDNGVGQTNTTSTMQVVLVTYRFANGPTLSTPRARAKAIYVSGKTYVSGNWMGDDSTMDLLEENTTAGVPVGQMRGRRSPYMFADSVGRIMVMSAYSNMGGSFGYNTRPDGTERLEADYYDPSTGQTQHIDMPFSSKDVPMLLPDDAKTDDYHFTVGGSNYYALLSREGSNKYWLNVVKMDENSLGRYYNFNIPVKAPGTGEEITWRGSVIVNSDINELYMIGASGPVTDQTLHIISFNYDTEEWTIATATGFSHNLLTASWTLLKDGRLACTGGCITGDNDPQAAAYIFTPAVAGRGDTNPDPGGLIDRKFLVVETKDHVQTTYMLSERPEVTFVGNSLRITSAYANVTYNLLDVQRFTFETRSVTGVSELRDEQAAIDYDDGQLIVSGIKQGASVGIYSMDGKMVKQLQASHSGTFRISLSSLPQGMYIVKADNVTYKIMKR